MQIDLHRIRRGLSAIAHTPFRRTALLATTGVTALAAAAAGAGAPASAVGVTGPAPTRVAPASDASAIADGADRATKIRMAKARAQEAKAARAERVGIRPAPDAPTPPAANSPAENAPAEAPPAADSGTENPADATQRGANASKRDKAPAMDELLPHGVPGGQQAFTPSAEQMRNAQEIVDTGVRMKLPERAYVIAVATALQESKLQNLGHLGARNDHDSLGLFQQRPSTGWGTPEQVTDPGYAAEQFYRGLRRVPGYETMPLTRAAQTVQVSAFPDAYAQWEKMAADIVRASYGEGPYADIAAADK